ncbi:MAG: GFA family protein [Paracoccus sp. (in: a-proteobacteria)]
MSKQTYAGSCQCGAIAYEVAADLDQTFACNCSRCRRMGFVLTFVPEADFRLTGDGAHTEYRFNRHAISHRFCPVCGVQPYAVGSKDGQVMIAVNVNCLDGVDARALASTAIDGASF